MVIILRYLSTYFLALLSLLVALPALGKQPERSFISVLIPDNETYYTMKAEKEQRDAWRLEYRRLPHLKKLTVAEAERGKELLTLLDDKETVINFLERLIILCADHPEKLEQYRRELAELQFNLGNFEKAIRLYVEYNSFYPGGKHKQEIDYKIILCHHYQTLQSDRDQTKTEHTLALIERFLEKGDLYAQYRPEILKIQTQCYEKIVGREFYVCEFYKKRGDYVAATGRLDYIRKNLLSHLPSAELRLLELEIELAHTQQNVLVAQVKQQELEKKFPHVTVASQSQTVARKDVVALF